MFRTFNDMTDMFEESLNKEENTLKITRTEKGRQPIKGDQEKGEDNTDNIVAAQNPVFKTYSNSNIETNRLKIDLSEQLSDKVRGNLCKTNEKLE